jgi:ribosomal protein S18 acetylase RimI-like enzyme
MLERGVGEFAPPFGRALENGDGETIGIVAGPLSRTELARARLQAAQVAGELGLLDAGLAARGRLARDTLLALTDDDQYLSRIAVHASARGRGAARVLLESFLSAARARGGRRAVLEVSPMHAGAIGLYESFGFVTLCERRADDPASGRSLVYRHMALTLPERAQ